MTVLIDTQAFIWFDAGPARLSPRAAQVLADPNNVVLLSAASVWEMVIKAQLGKLSLRDAVQVIVTDQITRNAVRLLDVRADHAYAVGTLPAVHKDPFDRILAAQAIVEAASLVTADAVFAQYPVTVEW